LTNPRKQRGFVLLRAVAYDLLDDDVVPAAHKTDLRYGFVATTIKARLTTTVSLAAILSG